MTKPLKDSPEWDLWIAALEVAAGPPLRPHAASVLVPASRLRKLRDALDVLGVDWREVKASGERKD